MPAAAEPADAELDAELTDALDTYVPMEVSTLGKILPKSSARVPAPTKIMIVPVSDEGGVKVYVYAPGEVCINLEGTVTHVAFEYEYGLVLAKANVLLPLLPLPEHRRKSTS